MIKVVLTVLLVVVLMAMFLLFMTAVLSVIVPLMAPLSCHSHHLETSLGVNLLIELCAKVIYWVCTVLFVQHTLLILLWQIVLSRRSFALRTAISTHIGSWFGVFFFSPLFLLFRRVSKIHATCVPFGVYHCVSSLRSNLSSHSPMFVGLSNLRASVREYRFRKDKSKVENLFKRMAFFSFVEVVLRLGPSSLCLNRMQ